MEKTAVEWLFEQILLTPLDIRSINKCLEQAKEMEKEQIMDAWFNGTTNWDSESSSEQYYNETFKSE